ncbi:cytochrome P450 [Paraburkholderia sp. J10-1]|uniref:cytochrome P450 n=1 Tax=Paraburkholderia sp. J10-1 TaxID=2805430 RepID=UPI002AB768DC|nr:cytochrome P450 [Paraburkholderia sp. J10-1]
MDAAASTAQRLRQVRDLPCPRGLPLIGNLHQLNAPRLHRVLEHWAQELGTPYRFQICGTPVTVWSDAELSQSVMRERPHRYRRYASLEPVLAEIGCNGVFSAEGAAWQPQRRLVMQALSVPHIRAFYPTLQAITARLHDRWRRAAERGDVVEMTDDLKRYTVDVTSALAFGEDPRTLEQERGVIQEHLAQIFPTLMHRVNAPFPYWRYVRLPRDRRTDRALAEVHRTIRGMMARSRERMRDEPSSIDRAPRHLLEAMLALREQPDSEPGSDVTDDIIAANVLTLLLAGEDTTANALAWSLYYLGADEPLQQRLAGEARAVLGAHDVCPDYGLVKDLDLFEAVCSETLRFRPVAAIMAFEPVENVEVGGVALPAGSKMFFLTRPPMLDARHYAQPGRFDPDRWLRGHAGADADADARVHDPRAWVQFGAGPRVCPGRHLAAMEMRLVLSMLTNHFKVRLAVDPATIEEITAFAMVPNRMPVRLEWRTDAKAGSRAARC